MINNVVNLDRTTFEQAKSLIARANLTSVRFVKFSTLLSRGGASEEPIDLSSTAKSTGENVDGGVALYFDLKILGTRSGKTAMEITARIEALYELSDNEKPTAVQIKAFAKSNGMLNIWPYWREYVQSATQRVGFAPLTLPLFRVIHSGPQKATK